MDSTSWPSTRKGSEAQSLLILRGVCQTLRTCNFWHKKVRNARTIPLTTHIVRLFNPRMFTNLELLQIYRPARKQNPSRSVPRICKNMSWNGECNTSGNYQTSNHLSIGTDKTRSTTPWNFPKLFQTTLSQGIGAQ